MPATAAAAAALVVALSWCIKSCMMNINSSLPFPVDETTEAMLFGGSENEGTSSGGDMSDLEVVEGDTIDWEKLD